MITNIDDSFFDNLPARKSEFDTDPDEEMSDKESPPSKQQEFVRNLNAYPFLLQAASGQISLAALAEQLGYKNRSSALRFLRKGFRQLHMQFKNGQNPD